MSGYMATKFGNDFLDEVVEWVHENYTIDELYTVDEIGELFEEKAHDYGYVKEGETE